MQRALDSLPAELARGLENVAVVVEDEHPDDPDLFGLYEGTPLPERTDAAVAGALPERTDAAVAGALPDRIAIYRVPLEESFTDRAELEKEIRITVLHELAHYFGIEEERLEELGYD